MNDYFYSLGFILSEEQFPITALCVADENNQ